MSVYVPAPQPTQLPALICGPILRRLTRTQISVWATMCVGGDVTLHVRQHGVPATESTVTTTPTRIGRNLWLIVLTIDGIDTGEFVADQVYEYWLSSPAWTTHPGPAVDWTNYTIEWEDTNKPVESFPSFIGLPTNIDDFKLYFATCRKASERLRDAFGHGYRLMTKDGEPRPHLLILGGDQIYADEFSTPMMSIVEELNNTYVDFDEFGDEVNPGIFYPKPLLAGRQERCFTYGFTTKGGKAHLWTLGEFYITYLLSWSPWLWPAQIPDFPDPAFHDQLVLKSPNYAGGTDQKAWGDEQTRLINYLAVLPEVQRLLANVPTLMVFDDHEATDDWNLDYNWMRAAYMYEQGSRIIANALMAYFLFQHWGNIPDQVATAGTAEAQALNAATWSSTTHPAETFLNLYHWLGMPEPPPPDPGPIFLVDDDEPDPDPSPDPDPPPPNMSLDLTDPHPVPDAANFDPTAGYHMRPNIGNGSSIRYDFRIDAAEGYPFHLVFLDERTARFVAGMDKHFRAARVAQPALDLMWPTPTGPVTAPTILTAAAPVLGLNVIEHILQPAIALREKGESDREFEGWSGYLPAFEHLLRRIYEHEQVLILSGDVHFGYTHTLDYTDVAAGTPTRRAVQFVSSGLKYGMTLTAMLHHVGNSMEQLGVLRPRTFYGYVNHGTGIDFEPILSQLPTVSNSLPYDDLGDVILGRVLRMGRESPAVFSQEVADAYGLGTPDWEYTINYVTDENPLETFLNDPTVLMPDGQNILDDINLVADFVELPNDDFPWFGFDRSKSLTMLKAIRAADLHRIGRVICGVPLIARISFNSLPTLVATQELFNCIGQTEQDLANPDDRITETRTVMQAALE